MGWIQCGRIVSYFTMRHTSGITPRKVPTLREGRRNSDSLENVLLLPAFRVRACRLLTPWHGLRLPGFESPWGRHLRSRFSMMQPERDETKSGRTLAFRGVMPHTVSHAP